MPALVIAGVEVKAANIRRLPDETNGQWVKSAWAADLIALTATERDAIHAHMSPGPLQRMVNGQLRGRGADKTVSGDEIGASVTARIQRAETEHVRVGVAVGYYTIPVTIRQV